MEHVKDLPPERLSRALTYAGFVLVANELMTSMIVRPIKFFYEDVTFTGGPFKNYDDDVKSRHKNEFEACLMYLRDFMEAINDQDFDAIQALRAHRNVIAHDVVDRLARLHPTDHRDLWINAERALYRLSQYRTKMEIGADPEFAHIDLETVKGHNYLIFEAIVEKVGVLSDEDADDRPAEDPNAHTRIALSAFEAQTKSEDPHADAEDGPAD